MKILKILALVVLLIVLLGIVAYRYYLHIDAPDEPSLPGNLIKQTLTVDKLPRHFSYYLPASASKPSPLVFVLHGSQSQSADMRKMTGYQFERLAEEQGFIVVYPDGYQRHWNDCRASASYAANTEQIDDIAFFKTMLAFFNREYAIDRQAVFATGFSNGGHMAYKLAYELPEAITGIAAIAANLPVADNLDCKPSGQAVSVAVFNGTEDPVNPYQGGLVEVFGDTSRGSVLSSRATIDYWRQLAGIRQAAIEVDLPETDGNPDTRISLMHWASDSGIRISLYTLHGSGHVVPSRVVSFGAMLGGDAGDLEAAEEIWDFFHSLREMP